MAERRAGFSRLRAAQEARSSADAPVVAEVSASQLTGIDRRRASRRRIFFSGRGEEEPAVATASDPAPLGFALVPVRARRCSLNANIARRAKMAGPIDAIRRRAYP
jgi:hypothetical protein